MHQLVCITLIFAQLAIGAAPSAASADTAVSDHCAAMQHATTETAPPAAGSGAPLDCADECAQCAFSAVGIAAQPRVTLASAGSAYHAAQPSGEHPGTRARLLRPPICS